MELMNENIKNGVKLLIKEGIRKDHFQGKNQQRKRVKKEFGK
jgi:hypothetical protein